MVPLLLVRPSFPFGVLDGRYEVIVSIPDHFLSKVIVSIPDHFISFCCYSMLQSWDGLIKCSC